MADSAKSRNVLELCDQALSLDATARQDYLKEVCGDDIALRASVDSVLIAIEGAGGFLDVEAATPESREALLGRVIGPYTVLEPLGEGGMGTVYKAERRVEDFLQTVAIKFVHGHMLARELIRRFEAERKILAGLSHPYIAALIDGGTTTDGIPYLVMEYVDGEPIDDYCNSRQLGLHARIKLLQKIATAVQAAHQNLIVHRDLKPSNVLITADGIPKLLDFGIAKLLPDGDALERDGNTTVFGRQALTPDYASPEQILENQVTTVSDVYSLGVLAYQLLAGERPYHLETLTQRGIISEVESLSVPKPSTRLGLIASPELRESIVNQRATSAIKLRRMLAGDLDTVLLCALQREPERRYASAAEFSADLQRYLDGQPINARPDSAGYRLQRFIGRNKLPVAAAGLVVLTLIGGLSATFMAYLDAERARADAARRFSQVRELSNTLMFDIYSDIAAVPGTRSAQQRLIATAQSYLESLAAGSDAPVDLQLDAANGYARLYQLLAAPASLSPEQSSAAATARTKAKAAFTRLAQLAPEDPEVWLARGKFFAAAGKETLYSDNDPLASRSWIDDSLLAFEKARSLDGSQPEIDAQSLRARVYLSDSYKWQEDFEEAKLIADAVLVQAAQLETAFPNNFEAIHAIADAEKFAGQLNWFIDDFAGAIEHYERAIERYRRLIAGAASDSEPITNDLVDALWSLANTLLDSNDLKAAESRYREAIELVRVTVALDPDDTESARTYAILRGSLSAALARNGEGAAAIELMTEVNDWFTKQANINVDLPSAQRSLAVSYHMMADIHRDAGFPELECEWLNRTHTRWLDIDATIGLSDFDASQPERLVGLIEESCN